jgi:hypothetical protein
VVRTAGTYAAAAALLLVAGCGSSSAVSTSTPLADLGTQMSQPAAETLALVRGSAPDSKDDVEDDGSADVGCSGGKRREYTATVTGAMAADDDEASVRNRLSLVAQAGLKKAGAQVTTDLGKSADDVPAELDFTNKPSSPAQKRTYHTAVEVKGDAWTWTIHGQTACIAAKG